jgi:branched-chain amino acid transport system substrate-binding protein
MKKTLIGFTAVVAMAFVAFVCCGAYAAETIKLGVVEPLSGPAKDQGERYLEGVQYAAKIINESGGLLGRKIEVIAIDGEGKPDVSARKATNLILKDGVKFFGAGIGSAVGAAMSQLAEKQNALVYAYGMGAASLTGEKCSRNFFRICANTDQHSAALAQMVAAKGFKRVAIVAQDYSFGKEAVEAFKKKLKVLSPSAAIVAEIYHPLGTKDFAPYISQLVSAKADIVFTANWGNDLYLLIKQGRPMGLKSKIVTYYVDDDEMIETVGNDSFLVGDFGPQTYMLTIPGKKNQDFVEKAFKDLGHYPSRLANPYFATMFWAEAVKKAGSTDVDAVIKAWEGLTFDGPAGLWTMRACDHQNQMSFWGAEIVKDSKFFKHAYVGVPTMIAVKDVEVPCADTGCKMNK